MERETTHLKLNYIIVALIAVLVGFSMLFINTYLERNREEESDYSTNWTYNGTSIDTDTLSTHGGVISIYKNLPDKINFNDSLCFVSANIRFDVYIDHVLVYQYNPPKNLT
ncbi:MAG: hypothetical protein K5675_09840, partial [Lachnospiraceae bacterium]|nr:hypothetical protein [Lachnospiraceae bacterium]